MYEQPELYLHFRFLWCYLTHIIGIQSSRVCFHSYLSFSLLLEMELSSFLPSGVKWVTAGAHCHWMPFMVVSCSTTCDQYICSQLTQPLKEVNISDHISPSVRWAVCNKQYRGGCDICIWTVDTKSNPIQRFGANTYLANLAYLKTCMCSCVSASGLHFWCTFYKKTCIRWSSKFASSLPLFKQTEWWFAEYLMSVAHGHMMSQWADAA